MKKLVNYYFILLTSLSTVSLLQECHKTDHEAEAIAQGKTGHWEWVHTTTPTHIITPKSVGYTKQLAVGSDNQGAYVAFYRNDTLQRRENETTTDTLHTFVNTVANTVLVKYQGAGFINYMITVNDKSVTMTISEFLNPYSSQADTVKSLYTRADPQLYPY